MIIDTVRDKIVSMLEAFGYQVRALDEYIKFRNDTNVLNGTICLLNSDRLSFSLYLGSENEIIGIVESELLNLSELDSVLSACEVALIEVKKMVVKSNQCFDYFPSVYESNTNQKLVDIFANRFSKYGTLEVLNQVRISGGVFEGMIVSLDDDLTLKVYIYNHTEQKTIYRKIVNESNYKVVFEFVETLIKEFRDKCSNVNDLYNQVGQYVDLY